MKMDKISPCLEALYKSLISNDFIEESWIRTARCGTADEDRLAGPPAARGDKKRAPASAGALMKPSDYLVVETRAP
jgi:hypothetical protein